MKLVLQITSRQASSVPDGGRKVFDGTGGSIGRTEENDWVLPAAGVSRQHARVRYMNGVYFIEDTSKNGMMYNGQEMPRGEPVTLQSGDRLGIDVFEIGVTLTRDAVAAPPPAPRMESAPAIDSLIESAATLPGASLVGDLVPPSPGPAGSSQDPLAALGGGGGGDDLAPAAPARSWAHSPTLEDNFQPPRTEPPAPASANVIPDDWDITGVHKAQPPPPPPPPPRPQPGKPGPRATAAAPAAQPRPASKKEPASAPARPRPAPRAAPAPAVAGEGLADVLQAAGLPATDVPAGVATAIGDILRIVTSGVMEVLRSRAEIKSQFRMQMTMIQRVENNPLKFAPSVDDALKVLLVQPNDAFLPSGEAFEDAFDDIRAHQLAMLAGMRAAFAHMLTQIDPAHLQEGFDEQVKRGFVAMPGKGKYWEYYQSMYADWAQNPGDSFNDLFGDEFTRAYDEQLRQLRAANKAKRRGRGAGTG